MKPLWSPSPAQVENAKLTAFRRLAEARTGRSLPDYDALHAWSVDDRAAFWALAAEDAGLRWHDAPTAALVDGDAMPGARWFVGGTLSYAENLLAHPAEDVALVAADESGGRDTVTFGALRRRVAAFQRVLRAHGVGEGDRVAAWMPNRVETVVAMLAASGLGAVFSSSSPDFGIQGVLDRFGQIAPKVLLATDGSVYGGKRHGSLDKLAQVARSLGDSLEAVVVVGVLDEAPDVSAVPKAVRWSDVVADVDEPPTFLPLPFDHPLFVMYSSGTTGVPKCIVHGQGGTLLQHAKEHRLHTDVGPEDVVFYFTTCGWMMWNWLVGGLQTGATVVLWDGSPAHPSADALWQLAEDVGITVFGTSPKFLSMCAKEGLRPGQEHDLSRLRAVLSTGSPLSAENFAWVYEHVGDVQLASICGGTDIISCFMLGAPTEPVYPGEIQKRGLGMAVEAWAGPGEPVVGRKAELVCTKPFPSMPVGFWNDPEGTRYHRAYFDVFPGVWRHGDFVEITERGGVIVYGRSDATLNPGGVRIGTAEIDRPVEAHDAVLESLVVGLPTDDDDVRIVLFVVLRDGIGLDDALRADLRRAIRTQASPRHVPAAIHAAPAVPRTLSGKKVEIAVATVLQGGTAPNRDALANPEALDWFAGEGRRLVGG